MKKRRVTSIKPIRVMGVMPSGASFLLDACRTATEATAFAVAYFYYAEQEGEHLYNRIRLEHVDGRVLAEFDPLQGLVP